jgi:hypothetical protein
MLHPYFSAPSCQSLTLAYLLAEGKNKDIGLWHSDRLGDPHANNTHQSNISACQTPNDSVNFD